MKVDCVVFMCCLHVCEYLSLINNRYDHVLYFIECQRNRLCPPFFSIFRKLHRLQSPFDLVIGDSEVRIYCSSQKEDQMVNAHVAPTS